MPYATNTILGEGDSIGLYWPVVFESLIASVDHNATGSAQIIAHMEPGFAAILAAKRATTDVFIMQGGINDIKTASADIADMKTALTTIITAAAVEIPDIFVMNISPWKNHTAWTAGRQTQTDDWNAWLLTQESVQGFTVIDTYAAMEDPGNADELLPAYDVSDGLHFNSLGALTQSALVSAAIAAAGVLNYGSPMNVNKRWRGAVEPSETGANGNVNKQWRGAVEPVGATDRSRNYLAITRRTASQMRPKQRMQQPKMRLRDL